MNDQEYKIIATILEVKGNCAAGHKKGDSFEINNIKSNGLCGSFYHNIFPSLLTYQYGGKCPWWKDETLEFKCPDPYNQVTMKIEKIII
jgi:uncharacterized repeat protein (TIGR04076 family)